MPEHILFLTGRLARPRLERVLTAMQPQDFTYEIRDIGVKVAALMTGELIRRRLPRPVAADRVLLPGRCRTDLAMLSAEFGTPFERGPDDVKDLPAFFGAKGGPRDLSRHDLRIFAEIVEAPTLDLDGIMRRAAAHRAAGADVIDLGCLPDTPFPHLEQAVAALRGEGFGVSVDSADPDELRRGGRAGADYLLSLTEETLGIADEVAAVPVLIPARHGDLESLIRAMDALAARGRRFIADPILDPIHFGFTDSLLRYAELRRRRPQAEILMGTGNLTELTDADTTGITAVLMGIVSELRITNVLVVQVSPHCRRVVQEADAARRIMYAAREEGSLPSGIDAALMALRDRRPFASTPEEIAELAAQVSDDNLRIEVAEDGIHAYNRRCHHVGSDPYALFPHLGVGHDGPHAFYLGVELAKAEIAWRLGKRYVQDEPLAWGCAVDRPAEDLTRHKAAGPTLKAGPGRRTGA
ncbi:MAG: dihydropteroate synthase [Rhodospirillaceae bacterium]|nr:dihydropteroate synthase [Rhodospirillaceae bacterium]